MRSLKRAILATAKATGMLAAARWLTRRQIRILCYHGFAIADEAEFMPDMFVTGKDFEKRLELVTRLGYRVQSLQAAVEQWQKGEVRPGTLVITIDDGFYSTVEVALAALRESGFTATLYASSFYIGKQAPVFGLAMRYFAWLAGDRRKLGPVFDELPELTDFPDEKRLSADAEDLASYLVTFGESNYDFDGQQDLLRRFAVALDCDFDALRESRKLGFVNEKEAAQLERAGVSIELHTHRHRFPAEPDLAADEIKRNREKLEPVIGRRMRHFCYPSGDWSPDHWRILADNDVLSATTCERELVRPSNHRYALPRILDDSRMTLLEFEAEISGFLILLRRIKRRIAGRGGA